MRIKWYKYLTRLFEISRIFSVFYNTNRLNKSVNRLYLQFTDFRLIVWIASFQTISQNSVNRNVY